MTHQIDTHAKIRVVLIGDTEVGKSTLCRAIKGNLDLVPASVLASVKPNSTIGAEFSTSITNNETRFELWDTAGQERYRALVPLYLRQADIFLLLFDVSERTSFNSIDGWIDLVQQRKESSNAVPILLVANKIDLRPDASQNSQNNDLFKPRSYYVHDIEATNKAQEHHVPLFCTSAITGIGIDKLKQTLETYAYPTPRDSNNDHSNTSDIFQLGSFRNINCGLADNMCKM